MDEYLWPARNVAEYAYCPRLFYLMEVEGIHIHNADTESGMTVHKRVDAPSAMKDEEEPEPDRPKAARSLTLTSEKLRLTATLDIAEFQGKTATPVEYRKGRPRLATLAPPPDDPGESNEPVLNKAEPWPTDRVQLGLQAILLEEAGYKVNEGVIYYAAEKRRLHVLIDDMLRGEALSTLDAAKKCACGPRPDPLVNDSRCLRCSLMPICLPDEINAQRNAAATDEPRRMWPARADGIQIVAQQEGTKLGIRGACQLLAGLAGKEFSARQHLFFDPVNAKELTWGIAARNRHCCHRTCRTPRTSRPCPDKQSVELGGSNQLFRRTHKIDGFSLSSCAHNPSPALFSVLFQYLVLR